jgi:hypothetical protein
MSEIEPVPGRKTAKTPKKASQAKLGLLAAAAVAATGSVAYVAKRAMRQKSLGVIFPDSRKLDAPVLELGARTRQKFARLVAESLDPRAAAELLGSTPMRIKRRIRDRTLYGFYLDRAWHLPAFQFRDGRVVPGLEQVLPKLDRDLHPLEVANWMTLPEADLVLDDEAVSPIEWLAAGGDAAKVAKIAEWVGSGL